MTTRRTHQVAAACAVAALAGGFAACGGSESAQSPTGATATAPTRQAAAGDTRTCPPKTGFTYKATIRNWLAVPIHLDASEYDCNDWDGVSTPGHAFTGQVIQPGEKRTFTLQPARNTVRNWTMEFTAVQGTPFFGRARLFIPKSVAENEVRTDGSTMGSGPKNRHGVSSCWFLPMESTGAPATAWDELEDDTTASVSVISRGGRITLATMCGTGGQGGNG